eukprot:335749-Amphidinium_carterae.1
MVAGGVQTFAQASHPTDGRVRKELPEYLVGSRSHGDVMSLLVVAMSTCFHRVLNPKCLDEAKGRYSQAMVKLETLSNGVHYDRQQKADAAGC